MPELGGIRPDPLFEVMPQERDQRRAVVQIVDTPLVVPSLDVPMPQMENQLAEVSRQLDIRIPEQAIEAPKISSSPRPSDPSEAKRPPRSAFPTTFGGSQRPPLRNIPSTKHSGRDL